MSDTSVLGNYLSKLLINPQREYISQTEYFSELHQHLYQLKYVEISYLENLIMRENASPTGLITPGLNIAIPHTSPQHIKKPFIAITQLTRPLTFNVMGSLEETVEVEWIFALGIQVPEQQLTLLQTLMNTFSNPRLASELKTLTTVDHIYDYFSPIKMQG